MAYLAKLVNKNTSDSTNNGTLYSKLYYKVTNDIDLSGKNWTPIGTETYGFSGHFDGNNKTISNLVINLPDQDYVGLFGLATDTSCEIKDLTIENASVNGQKYVAALAGSKFTSQISNCTVKGSIKIEGNYDVAGLSGYGYGSVTNCNVIGNDGSYIKGTPKDGVNNAEGDNIAGLIGYRAEETCTTSGCKVENITISGTRKVAGLFGTGYCKNNVSSCAVERVKIICTATKAYAEDSSNEGKLGIGGLIGQLISKNSSGTDYVGGKLENCTINEVSIEFNTDDNSAVMAKMSVGLVSGGLRNDSQINSTAKNALLAPTNSDMTISGLTVSGSNSLPQGIKTFSGYGNELFISGPVAQVGTTNYSTLSEAFDAVVSTGGTIKLLCDTAYTSPIERDLNEKVTLNLNGRTITGIGDRALWVKSGEMKITGGGKIQTIGCSVDSKSVIRLGNTGHNNPTLTIDSGVTVYTDSCYGVTVFGSDTDKETLIVNGNVYSKNMPAISGNGSSGYCSTDITIGSTAKVGSESNVSIYNPQAGTLTIEGTVEGSGGIELKSGSATVTVGNSAVIKATAKESKHTACGNGPSTNGYAISVVNNTAYKGNSKAIIEGGSIIGKVALLDDDGNSDNNTGSIEITGGTFSSDPSAYVKSGYTAVTLGTLSPTATTVKVGSTTLQSGKYYVASSSAKYTASASGYNSKTETLPSSSSGQAGVISATLSAIVSSSDDEETANTGSGSGSGTASGTGTGTNTGTTDKVLGTTTETDAATGTVTETTTTATGTTIKETTTDGQVTETVKDADGKTTQVTVTEANGTTTDTKYNTADNSFVTTTKTAEGIQQTTDVDGSNKVTKVEASIPAEAVSAGSATLPKAVAVTEKAQSAAAPEITITAPAGTQVTIPVAEDATTIVVIKVNPDGTEEIVKIAPEAANGVVVPVESGDAATYKVVNNAKTFTDVSADEWYSTTVTKAAAREIMNGVGDTGTFDPNGVTSRAMMAQILFNVDNAKATGTTANFGDLADGAWYTDAIAWAAGAGVVTGYSDTGTFDPEGNVTREQAITMLWRYAGCPTDANVDNLSKFADASNVSDYAKQALAWATENNILQGNNGQIKAGDNATRAEIAALALRYCTL